MKFGTAIKIKNIVYNIGIYATKNKKFILSSDAVVLLFVITIIRLFDLTVNHLTLTEVRKPILYTS